MPLCLGAKAIKFADFGEGNGVIFLDSVKCLGTEKFLNECISDPLAVHNCGHNKDAGVICEGMNYVYHQKELIDFIVTC